MFKFISLSHWKKFQCENLPLPVSREDLEGATSSTPSISNFVRSEIRLTKNISIIKRRIYFYTKFNFKFHCSPLCVCEVRTRIRLEKMWKLFSLFVREFQFDFHEKKNAPHKFPLYAHQNRRSHGIEDRTAGNYELLIWFEMISRIMSRGNIFRVDLIEKLKKKRSTTRNIRTWLSLAKHRRFLFSRQRKIFRSMIAYVETAPNIVIH